MVVINIGNTLVRNRRLTPLRSPWTISCSCRNFNPVTAPTSCPNDQCDGGVHVLSLTRLRRLYVWFFLMKSIMFPYSISAETIEIRGGVNMTPTNGSIFSCSSHLQPTTSLMRSLCPVLTIALEPLGAKTYLVHLLVIPCSGDLELLYCDRTSFKGCLVHLGITAGCEWCSGTFDGSWWKNE